MQNPGKQIFRQKAMDKAFAVDELDKMMQVTRPTGWLALLAVAIAIAGALVWSSLAHMNVKVSAGGIILDNAPGGKERAVIFLPLAEKDRVKPQMTVQMSPAGSPPQQYGYLLGAVSEVSQQPLTAQNMTEVLKNDALVAFFAAGGPQIMVTVELQTNAVTGGYAWTTARGGQISPGTLFVANIIVDQKRPIALLLPE